MSDQTPSEQNPRPRYGEYAPGYTPPTGGQDAGAQPATPPAPPAGQPAWAPVPQQAPAAQPPAAQYGTPQYGAPQYGASPWTPGAGPKPRRTWDVVVTVILLVLAVVGTLIACGYAAIFNDPQLLDQALRDSGRGGFTGSAGAAPVILVVSHLVLLLLAVGLSVLALVKRRIAFWIPLSIGVLAAIIFWGTLVGVLLSDPSFLKTVSG